MAITISAEFDEGAIVRGLQNKAEVDFQSLADTGRTTSVSITQTEDGAVYFDVTLRTYAVEQQIAQQILGSALI